MQKKKDLVDIPGGYQAQAMFSPNVVQRTWHREKLRVIDEVCPPVSSGDILDAGCGSGFITLYLARNGANVLGVDSNSEACEYASRNFASANCRFRCGQFQDIHTYGDFDQIYCIEVIEHLYLEQTFESFRHFHDLLKPDGILLVTTPNPRSLWPVIELVLDIFRLTPKIRGDQHVSSYNLRRLKNLLMQCGFKVCASETFNGFSTFASILGKRFSNLIRVLEVQLHIPGNLIYVKCKKLDKN